MMEIYNEAIRTTTATFDMEPKTYENRVEWFAEHTGKYLLVVFEKESQIAGYASLSKYRERAAFSESVELSIYVGAEYRHQGIGKALMEYMLSYAEKRGDIYTVLSLITGENKASIRLHEQSGFRFCGRIQGAGKKFGRYLDLDVYQWMCISGCVDNCIK